MKRMKLIFLFILITPFLLQNTTHLKAQSSTSPNRFYNMSYLFFGGLNTYVSQVDRTKGNLQAVSPNYFDITANGDLDVTWKLQTSFISEMHKRGIKVTPFLANHWNQTAGINGLNNRVKLAQDIAAAIEKYNLDGINVDIEGVGHTYRNAHTDFVRLLRQYIPQNKEIAVAVAANPNGWNTGWHGFYDYKSLSQYANYLMIMAYDESWESPDSPIGPVSSQSFFERSILYAINQGVSRDRIVIGLPFYGRIWKLDGPNLDNRSITGMGVSSTRVLPLVNQFKGTIKFDEKTQSPNATFTIPQGQEYFIGSTRLTEGRYSIWYENEQSIRAKLSLPAQYQIKGTGSWALSHETEDTWNYYTVALNGNTLTTNIPTTFESGPIGIIIVDNVNFRESASLNGRVLKILSKGSSLKITGPAVTAENYVWYPVQLNGGITGYVAENYLKDFNLKEVYGQNRYDTGVQVSSAGWNEGSNAVVLGRGDLPIDALTGSVLAKKFQAPMLLTMSSSLPDNVAAELNRLQPKTVYIIGGLSAVSKEVQLQIEKLGYSVKRIAGKNRYDTSVQVANEIGINSELILTTGKESPDALSIAPYAGIKQFPILFTEQNSLPPEVKGTIQNGDIQKVTIIGGENAISAKVAAELSHLGVKTIERIAGANRYETSVAIASRFQGELNLKSLYFASGVSFIDALPGSAMAALNGSPILLTNNTSTLPTSLRDFLEKGLPATPDVTILGGYGVIPNNTRATIFQALK